MKLQRIIHVLSENNTANCYHTVSHGCFYWKPRSCQVFFRWVWKGKMTHYTNCLVCYPGDQARGNNALESCLVHWELYVKKRQRGEKLNILEIKGTNTLKFWSTRFGENTVVCFDFCLPLNSLNVYSV